jgi:ribosomal protein L30/L7E
MPKFKIKPPLESKLSKTITKIAQDGEIEKSGFVNSSNDKTIYYKTKSFRLRQSDAINLTMIVKEVNKTSHRKIYSDSEVIRGLINYVSDNIEVSLKKLSVYIKNSS